MTSLISQEEVKEIFEEYIKESKTRTDKKKSFKGFLDFLEIDIYDWIRENLRCYFRKER